MSIRNILTNNNKPDQELQVNSINSNEMISEQADFFKFNLFIEFVIPIVYVPPVSVTITHQHAIIPITSWPTSAFLTTVPITINYAPIAINAQTIFVTLDASGSGASVTSNWVPLIYSVSSGSFVVHCVYINNSGSSTNTIMKLNVLIIPNSTV